MFSCADCTGGYAYGEEIMVMSCKICGLIQRVEQFPNGVKVLCARCGATITERKVNSLARTAAFSLAALLFYVPANLFPILRMEHYGAYSESTIWDGCVKFYEDGDWFVATIVFLASILVPLLKLLGLFFLVTTATLHSERLQKLRTSIYQTIQVIGPWAMLDVFLLSILVALVKLKQLATILPGPGAVAFTAVVVCTILASSSFDPRLIWRKSEPI
jgi:paraquat-inducible protein A